MAESVKRRVAAARLAVAFVAAGTIAGASAWAQASPPPPTAQSSALNAYLKLKSSNIVDGSLLFEDMQKHQVPSWKEFKKFQASGEHFKKAVLGRYYTKAQLDSFFVKGESSDYVKHAEFDGVYFKYDQADALYIKQGAAVNGDGSVHTATASVGAALTVKLLDVPNLFTVDAKGPEITITNTSGGTLTHGACGALGGGTLAPNGTLKCTGNESTQTMQLITGGTAPSVVTLSFSAIPNQGLTVDTVQILIGL